MGKQFCTAIVYDFNTKLEVDKIVLRLPNHNVTNEWVKTNVLLTLNFEVTHENEIEFLKTFANFYMKYKENSEIIWHMGHVVEAYLFRTLVEKQLIGEWDAPYCPIEVSETLRCNNEKADSVDTYIKKYKIEVKNYGSTHNPLYDCEATAKCYFHLIKN